MSKDSPAFRKVTNFKEVESYSITLKDRIIGYIYLKEVKACNLGGCQVKSVIQDKGGIGEYFDLMVLTNTTKDIKFKQVFDYFSEFGYEVCNKSYLKQFYGHSLCSKENLKVDAISGATISSEAIINSLFDFCDL